VCGVLLSRGGTCLAAQEGHKKDKPAAPRPPGTCGGWTDKDRNGICERSQRTGEDRCTSRKCPANQGNPLRETAKANGAPEGTCALWEDPNQAGSCAVCVRAENPCVYTACPAHKNTTAQKADTPVR
jgi:hypothetical protein